MLCEDMELCRTMGKAGRKKAVELYGEETYYEKLTAIYNELEFRVSVAKKRDILKKMLTFSKQFPAAFSGLQRKNATIQRKNKKVAKKDLTWFF